MFVLRRSVWSLSASCRPTTRLSHRSIAPKFFSHHSPLNAPVPTPIMQKQRNAPNKPFEGRRHKNKKARLIEDRTKSTGFDEVLQADIDKLLKCNRPDQDQVKEAADSSSSLPEPFTEVDATISELSSTGDGLALSDNGDHVFVVPFTVPGDKARIRIVRHFPELSYSSADFIRVIEPGPLRDDSRIKCGYFAQCSGCQLQMMSYEDQLAHKRRIVEKAYANFSGLVPELVPEIGETFPSPMQFGYRTKLTPHFTLGGARKPKVWSPEEPTVVPPIGFSYKGRRGEMDIEDCPLGTDIVRRGLKSERKRVTDNIRTYSRGATILLRESTTRVPKEETPEAGKNTNDFLTPGSDTGDLIQVKHEKYTEEKRCIKDQNAKTVEYVDDYIFSNKAGAFFQNNNSILSGFTEFIRSQAIPAGNDQDPTPIKYLLDAYSGSGLFTITLSPLFKSSLGVDVAGDSIVSARENVRANNLPSTGFAAADAAVLFKDVPYPPDQTLLVIDPPRKGCSEDFLQQLLSFKPRRVVYVSCNVHTQARDVAVMVQGDETQNVRYEIESIRGFDFFPQTGHVEGVAILNRASFPSKQDSA